MDIEQRLRDSLAAKPAPPDFESALMARLREASPVVAPRRRRFPWQMPAALVATVLATAVGLHWHNEQQRAAQGRDQLMLALAITSNQLNAVQQRLTRPVTPVSEENGT